MRPEVPDSELVRLFEQERRDTEAGAPDLGALLARPRRRAVRLPAVRLVALAATLAAVVSAATLLRISLRSSRAAGSADLPPAARELANWKAPTDVLLATPGSDLWRRVPLLAPRVPALDLGAPLEATKGVER
jgi:hypothetical protein